MYHDMSSINERKLCHKSAHTGHPPLSLDAAVRPVKGDIHCGRETEVVANDSGPGFNGHSVEYVMRQLSTDYSGRLDGCELASS